MSGLRKLAVVAAATFGLVLAVEREALADGKLLRSFAFRGPSEQSRAYEIACYFVSVCGRSAHVAGPFYSRPTDPNSSGAWEVHQERVPVMVVAPLVVHRPRCGAVSHARLGLLDGSRRPGGLPAGGSRLPRLRPGR